jgi:nicotinate-nucleotide--dimethylbenzimidazole phosphoribosyltransferase
MTSSQRLLAATLAAIAPLDAEAVKAARQRQDQLTKPRGSLGLLEDLSVQLCGLAGECPAPVPVEAAIAVFAGDHGVHARGVSPWPQEVTAQMVANFLGGGAVINTLAAELGARVLVVNVGVATELAPHPDLLDRGIRLGTADFTVGRSMSRDDAIRAIEVGIEVADTLIAGGARLLVTGDMGIANTTPSAALIAAFTGRDPADVTGRGTGIDDETWQLKVEVIRAGLLANNPDPADPIDVLSAVGGLEHAALAGFMLGAAARRVPVVLDGVIAASSALAAVRLAAACRDALIAGHRSVEPGARIALEDLGLRPLLDLDLRLGEGSGAALAVPIVRAAARVLAEVATFDGSGVTDKAQV